MRKFLLTLPFFALAAPANAACGYLPDLLAYGAQELGQVVTVTMTASGGDVLILVNPATGRWSMLGVQGTQACVLLQGDDFETAADL